MVRRVLLAFVLAVSSQAAFAADYFPLDKECFSLEGSAKDVAGLMKAVFGQLQSLGTLPPGFPQYGKTEVVGEYWAPHTVKAVPAASVDEADAVLVGDGRFVSFKVWGLNARSVSAADFIYLLKERDEEAVRSRMEGVWQYKYVEINYESVFPVSDKNGNSADFAQANRMISSMRRGLLRVGCKRETCIGR